MEIDRFVGANETEVAASLKRKIGLKAGRE